ncbi:Ger(x)C family spore germination protein [Pseudalkalibacillus hwajinpoensis]|uniref:Ger(x)C family spore germination protein n=1 Tax=Guptibacillus hwajinpoensis TaxID=208199 RepID=UPI001CD3E9EA|nr:Ger(x)C family spore germination protein [Pseudalkalibacillus hwajinpoensis]MCA0993262.1 Ger(x)C family spore germination protein [Pseudalkalibacillus hwajinpoensis]
MKKTWHLSIIFSTTLLFLTSCWDQELLKESKLIYGAGLDYENENEIRTTFAVRNLGIPVSQGGVYSNRILSVSGSSPRDTRIKVDRVLSKQVTASKNQLILLGKEIARKDIDHIFDVLYRDPKGPLDARVGVVDGRAEDMLNLDHIGDTLITEFMSDLIKGAENKTEAPPMTIEKTFRYSKDVGQDYALPYIRFNEDVGAPEINGIALFHQSNFTGVVLPPFDATLLLLMADAKSKKASIVENIGKEHDQGFLTQTVTINIQNAKSDIEYSFQEGNISKAVIHLEVRGNIEEYPQNHLFKESQVENIADELSKKLTERGNNLLTKLQEANCDFLGIGRDLNAYHHEAWHPKQWDKEFTKLNIEAKVKVKISETGIIK